MLAVSNAAETVVNYLGELNNSFKDNKVKKRNGQVVPFDLLKIYNAVDKCFGKVDCPHTVANVTYGVSHALFHSDKYAPDRVFTIEEVQDAVEMELMRSHPKFARKYIIYREQRAKAREDKKAFDVTKIMRTYLDQEDWRVKENSNSGYSIGGLIMHNASTMVAHYWLNNVYSKDFKDAHVNGDVHCHDLGFLGAYCLGHSLGQLIEDGLHAINGNLASKPAKHMQALMQQMVNYLGILQNESAGAQAFGSVDTYIAPFIAYDKLTPKEVKQNVQSLLFGLNIPSRWSGQSIFSNFTLDLKVNSVLKDRPVIIGGKWWKKPQADMISIGGAYVDSKLVDINSECYDPAKFYTYGDFQKEMDMFNTAFLELMYDGDMQGRIFSYPIPTINITKEFDWDSPVAKLLWRLTGKYGTPYFSNFINSEMKPEDSFSMCPLSGDTELLVKTSKGLNIVSVQQLYQQSERHPDYKFEVFTGSDWCLATPNHQEKTPLYKITLSNGVVVKMGESHLQPRKTKFGSLETVTAKELEIGHWLPFNKEIIDSPRTVSNNYNIGYAVGAYFGDGSKDETNSEGDYSVIYSLSDRKLDVEERVKNFWEGLGFKVTVTESDSRLRSVRVGRGAYNIIKRFIGGDSSTTKYMTNEVFNMNESFRRGLLDGYKGTDGSRSRERIYTASPGMVDSLCKLKASLGEKVLLSHTDTREGRLGTNPVYTVALPSRSNYGKLYDEDENYHYYAITAIERLDNNSSLYCLEVNNNNQLFMLANGLITHNCRLRLDKRELNRRGGGLFGASERTGSIGVVTINLPRIAYLVRKELGNDKSVSEYTEAYKTRLNTLLELAKDSLEIKRKTVTHLTEQGLFPYIKRYIKTWNNHFSTIGILGMNEACLNLLGKNIADPEARTFALEIGDYIRKRISDFQEETGNLYNYESTPGESTSYRFAKNDKKQFPDIITAGDPDGDVYYTNSTNLPVGHTSDIFEALDHQDDFMVQYTGGCVFHGMLGEAIDNPETVKKLVKHIAERYRLPYFSITPTFSVCKQHGYLKGKQPSCPTCNEDTEVYSRIVGYYRPVSNWHKGKKQEFKDRVTYTAPELKDVEAT